MEKKYNYLIVGAGLSGATFAYEAAKKGKTCLVVDERPYLAGNCHQEYIDGILVHCFGAHIFRTNNKNIWDYIQGFGKFVPFVNSPLGKYKDKFYNLPINMNTFNALWGVFSPQAAQNLIQEKKKTYNDIDNLEKWALSCVGQEIYDIFIKEYTEKQWGKKCCELPKSIMSRIPIRFEYNNNYYNELYQGVSLNSYDEIISKMLSCENIDIKLNNEFNLDNFSQFENLVQNAIIYTGALDRFFRYEYGELEWRGLKFEHEIYFNKNLQGVGVINHLESEVPFTRTIEHKNLIPEGVRPNTNFTIITKEYPQKWVAGDVPYYPITSKKNIELQKKYRECAQKLGIVPLGRLGNYKYISMDQAIEDALNCVDLLMGDKNG